MSGLFKWGGQKDGGSTTAGPPPADVLLTSKVFRKFIGALAHAPAPVILDLGPVVGANITFFGDRLSCKIYVEDLFAEVETATRKGTRGTLGPTLVGRLAHEAASVDGILVWDLFDFLDQATGRLLAAKLARLVRPGGALYGLFGTTPIDLSHYTRFVVESEDTLRQRPYPATAVRRHVLLARDINKMFDGLNVADAVLLKSSTRETLFRKP